jgi:hypothetical protein
MPESVIVVSTTTEATYLRGEPSESRLRRIAAEAGVKEPAFRYITRLATLVAILNDEPVPHLILTTGHLRQHDEDTREGMTTDVMSALELLCAKHEVPFGSIRALVAS